MTEAVARARSAKASMYRSLVVEAAERLFATRGYERTKIQEIASASGLSLGTLYSVFDGKADVYAAVHDERLGELFMLTGRAMKSEMPAADRLLEGNRVFIRWLAEHPDYLRIHLEGGGAWSSNPERAEAGLVRAWHRGIELMARVIERGMCDGDLWEGDPIVAARLMAATQQVYISAWFESGMKEGASVLASRIEEQLRRSLFRSDK
ncbi:MAG TPA: TetR/AcrR family transcriptional regulator [Polyangiales bacterium]|nr:TetR/AcrR family transcriptional regulator [Polyangiales bacterium]